MAIVAKRYRRLWEGHSKSSAVVKAREFKRAYPNSDFRVVKAGGTWWVEGTRNRG